MSKVIVEIDGVRHVMKKETKPKFVLDICEICSLNKVCGRLIGGPCFKKEDYFIIELEDEKILE